MSERHELAAGVLTELLFEEPGVGRCLVSPEGVVRRANSEWLRSIDLDLELDEVLGANVTDLLPGAGDVSLAMLARARAGHRVDVPRHAQRAHGRETWWEGSITPVSMDGGTGLLITAREVSGHSAPPGPPVQEPERLRSIADDAPFAVFAKSGDGRYVYANRYVAELLGVAPERLMGRRVSDILPPDEALRTAERERRAAAGHIWTEDVIPTPSGERTLLTVRFPLSFRDGDSGTCGVAFDVTDQIRAQDAAKRTEAVLEHAGAMAQLGAWWIEISKEQDVNSGLLRWSDEVYRIFGYEPGEVRVSNELFFQHVHPDDREAVMGAVARALATRERYAIEHRIVRRDGVERTVLERGEGQHDDSGRLVRVVGAVQDITERKHAEGALRESTALSRAISDTSTDVIFAKDREGRLRFANPAAIALIGKPLEQVIGRTDAELLEDAAAARHVMENDRRIMESGVAEDVEERIPLPDGRERFWFSRKLPYRDADGRVVGLLGIGRDITERKRAEDELRETNARLVEADRRKSEFLAVLSHELRNPLAPIRNSIFLLERAPPGSEQARRAKDVVRRQTEHLTRLVDDLLDITRITRGKVALKRTRVDLRDIVRKSTDDLLSVFATASVELRVDYGTFGPVWIDADPTRMAQVLGNLLQNSVKFTPSGGSVSVSLRVAGENHRAELRVRDDGAGMEPATIEEMFEPFAQATQTLARTEGGLGLGLALVKGIVEMHGGEVHARSEGLGHGSEFLVSLPLVDVEAIPDRERAAPAESAGKRVLVIEDNVDSALSLADVLGYDGHDVRVAHDGRSGLALAREFRPEVILCDIGLPGMDGYEVARAVRADDALRATRLIALSGYAQPEDQRRASDAGFDTHVAKPPEVEALMDFIARG